ncbi:hypothetical protein QQF64_023898 [Cirrhinus molitorella]|uniref:Uncharacterized protein n=1 Tax=Cirrhinus molitorella TaxID=172907 RepID=A0ABR3NKW4_9TELE
MILLGDFNARVGHAAHDLIITNTIFHLPTKDKKSSWMYSRSKHRHLIDYVIVRRKDRQDVLCLSHRKHQDWFDEYDEEIKALLAEKHHLHRAHQNDPLSIAKENAFKNTVQSKLHKMQDSWPVPKQMKSRSLLIEMMSNCSTRWAEHFQFILNRPSSINDEAIDRIPQVDINHSLDIPPSVTETLEAISQLSTGKAPGSDTIPAEVYKAARQLQDIEVNRRITKASSAFGRLRSNVWDHLGISLATKLKVYQAVALTTLMDLIRMTGEEEASEITWRFEEAHFVPQVMGLIDGTHIPILPPSDGYKDFVIRKDWPSYVLQAVVGDGCW